MHSFSTVVKLHIRCHYKRGNFRMFWIQKYREKKGMILVFHFMRKLCNSNYIKYRIYELYESQQVFSDVSPALYQQQEGPLPLCEFARFGWGSFSSLLLL